MANAAENKEVSFVEILENVQKTKQAIKTFPYVATKYLGAYRRGWRITQKINEMLEQYDVTCEPDFGSAWFYGEIEIKPKPKVTAGKNIDQYEETDPTPRLSLLSAANLSQAKENGVGKGLIAVKRETSLKEATTLMMFHGFSQLPILSGRQVEGMISWKSIGRAMSLGKNCSTVMDCKEEVDVLNYDMPLFDAVKVVLEREVVLVKQRDGLISGIVTVTDIGSQFISMAEPFLIIEQIENHVRRLLDQKFTPEDLKISYGTNDVVREVKSLSDLNFGDYVMLLADPEKFEKTKLNVDRVLLTKQLDEVRKIRNDVMHFDPDGITQESLELLRQTLSFLHTITTTLRTRK